MRLPVIIATLVVLAGCAAVDVPPAHEDDIQAPQWEEDRGRGNITVDRPGLPIDPPQDGERTPLEAPLLRMGEWWQIRLVEHFTGQEYDLMRVVAGTEHGDYLIGFPIDDFSNDALIFHTPGYGDVLPDLSYAAHDVPFVPLVFPLVEGNTWETAWESPQATIEMLVEEVRDDGTVLVTGTPTGTGARAVEIVYDAAIGEVRSLRMDGYVSYEVVDHGFGYEGDVRVPHAHDLVFLNGRAIGVQDATSPLNSPDPAGPRETIVIGEGYDRLSFALILHDIPAMVAADQGLPPVPAGQYSVSLAAPDGTVYDLAMGPADGAWIRMAFHGHEDPAGEWELMAVAGGVGVAFVEGIGYHSIDISLPSGCVLESKAAHHHGTLCRDERVSEDLPQG